MSPNHGVPTSPCVGVRVTRGGRQLGPACPDDFAERLASQLVFAAVRLREAERLAINVWNRVLAVRRAKDRVLTAAPSICRAALHDLERESHTRCHAWARRVLLRTPDARATQSPALLGDRGRASASLRARDLRREHMRRSWTHIRQILLAIELGEYTQCDEPSAHEHRVHLDLLFEAGLLHSQPDSPSVSTPSTGVVRLSWAGHDLLAMIRDERVWLETLGLMTPIGGDGGIDVLQSVAQAAAYRLLRQPAPDNNHLT